MVDPNLQLRDEEQRSTSLRETLIEFKNKGHSFRGDNQASKNQLRCLANICKCTDCMWGLVNTMALHSFNLLA